MDILIPVIIFGIIGLLIGVLLSVASKIFSVTKDDRIDLVLENLPGANCGGCGYAGCSACAEAIVAGKADVNVCPVNGKEKSIKIATIMGSKVKETKETAAFVNCSGDNCSAKRKYLFDGTKTCKDVYALKGGDKECEFSCLGYGDCVNVCKFGAITIADGIANIDKEKCTSCKMCVNTCPKKVIEILPKNIKVYVKCSSKDKGVLVKDKCKVGCIGCSICAKNCPQDAITITENLAHIDYDKCVGCLVCAEKCPKKIIKTV